MPNVLPSLIDKVDNFEIVRDQIAALLALNIANQKLLAVAASKDPALWDLRVYTERAAPWDQYTGGHGLTVDIAPIANVWFDSTSFNKSASTVMDRQKSEGSFNIDVYGYGVSQDDDEGGHKPGDREAAFEMQRALKLVRNILMASENTYLQLRGMVWGGWVQSVTSFQPQIDNRSIQNIVGARLVLKVDFNEFSPQYEGEALEFVSIDVTRSDNGQVLAELDYDYS